MARKQEYGNESITSLKGADRVRKRPAVIFGSDGVEGCAHSIFEIVSNSIDEARDGHGDTINVTRCKDGSVIVEDFGRGMPVDWNNGEGRYNWELLFCEMYAGGKYGEGEDNYEFSLGLNGLGLCATQYSSAWMTADIYRDGYHYHLDFKKGENVGGLQKEPYKGRRTGSIIHWKPDDEVFTDIDVPGSYYKDVLRRQAVVNAGLTLNFTDEKEKDPATGKAWKESWCYEHGIADYVAETAGEDTLTPVFSCESEATGRDREDQPEYKVKMSAAFCFSNKVQLLEYYHNSSWLEHGGSPEHAVRTAFVYQINKYLKDKNLYKKGESAISFQDVQDCLVYVSSSFSTRTSYENQTKKAITNKFVSQAMTDFLKHYLEVYFLEKPEEAQKICQQVLVNKQSREHATCIVIVESYHMLARQLIHEINIAFSNQIIIKEVLPLNRYLNRQPECDLVLTTLPLSKQHPHVVQISPILTKANCESIRAQLSSISTERELARARQFLQSLLHKELYFRNVSLSDAATYIHFMGEQCVKHGYAKEGFVQDVLQRESFSSTAFTDVLAVPHAINQYADRSFICVIHNDMPIQWKKKTVHFVLMIGITEAEMKFFKPAFDRIVELFNSTSRTLELLKTNTFEEFCEQMR